MATRSRPEGKSKALSGVALLYLPTYLSAKCIWLPKRFRQAGFTRGSSYMEKPWPGRQNPGHKEGAPGKVFKELMKYVAQNGVNRSIKPVFKTDDTALYVGDCLEVLPCFPDNYVDMIFADPPYMLSNNGITCFAGKMVSVNKGKWDKSKGFENDLLFHETWLKECRRVLKPEGTIWISGTLHSIYQCGYLLQKLNFHLLNDIAWFKPNAAPNLSCTVFAHSHETLLWARKDVLPHLILDRCVAYF